MDVSEALQKLYAEKRRLESVISSLELLVRNSEGEALPPNRPRRGRKSMSAEERQKVSERMKKYWADRRPR